MRAIGKVLTNIECKLFLIVIFIYNWKSRDKHCCQQDPPCETSKGTEWLFILVNEKSKMTKFIAPLGIDS
jgi:hypothetical protein